MHDSHKDTPLIISIVIVFVLVAGIIGYSLTRQSARVVQPTTSEQTQTASQSSDTSVPVTTNQSSSMDSQSALEKGKTFLAENAKQAGVTTLPSGLQYKVLVEGKGPKPTADQVVKVNYEGTLIDGTVFDSSYKRGQPIEFPVTGVIRGWVEGLQLMTVGSTWMLYIPSDLAYGPRGAGGLIGPNETLIFKVELLDAHKAN